MARFAQDVLPYITQVDDESVMAFLPEPTL